MMKKIDEDEKLELRTWGGRRAGAGRKATGSKMLGFQAPREIVEIVEQQENKSRFIANAVKLGLQVMREQRVMETAEPEKKETLKVMDLQSHEPVMIPYFDNKVAAGIPISPGDVVAERMDMIDLLCLHANVSFAVTVCGDSMIEIGILNNDTAIVDGSKREPVEGKPLLCELNGEYTIKMFKRTKDGALLIPANKDYDPIVVKSTDQFRIMGTVTSVVRTF